MFDEQIETIRAAIKPDATSEARAAGAAACRTIIGQLEQAPKAAVNPAAIAQAVAAMRGMPTDQLLDLAIAKLRTLLPAGVELPPVPKLKFPTLPVRG
ncbi:MAG TPA: hypothetical protein VGG74_01555 [Kofleriaceae bacterium]|jgi:hypothetical protein